MLYPSIKLYSGKNWIVFFQTSICSQLGCALFLKSVALSLLVCGFSVAWASDDETQTQTQTPCDSLPAKKYPQKTARKAPKQEAQVTSQSSVSDCSVDKLSCFQSLNPVKRQSHKDQKRQYIEQKMRSIAEEVNKSQVVVIEGLKAELEETKKELAKLKERLDNNIQPTQISLSESLTGLQRNMLVASQAQTASEDAGTTDASDQCLTSSQQVNNHNMLEYPLEDLTPGSKIAYHSIHREQDTFGDVVFNAPPRFLVRKNKRDEFTLSRSSSEGVSGITFTCKEGDAEQPLELCYRESFQVSEHLGPERFIVVEVRYSEPVDDSAISLVFYDDKMQSCPSRRLTQETDCSSLAKSHWWVLESVLGDSTAFTPSLQLHLASNQAVTINHIGQYCWSGNIDQADQKIETFYRLTEPEKPNDLQTRLKTFCQYWSGFPSCNQLTVPVSEISECNSSDWTVAFKGESGGYVLTEEVEKIDFSKKGEASISLAEVGSTQYNVIFLRKIKPKVF